MDLLFKQQEYFQKIMDSPELSEEMDLQGDANLNESWKILIFDDFTFNIVNNFKIGDLRENNITLHLHINEKKEELFGIQVIYFIAPKEDSIQKFLNDLKNGYFDNITLNFSGFVTKEAFSEMCQKIIDLKKTSCIKKIFQFNLDFYPMGNSLLNFNIDLSFGDESKKINLIAVKLLNFFFFMGYLPILVFDKNNKISKKIAERVKEMVTSEELFYKASLEKFDKSKKGFLFLKESENDLIPFLMHSFEYFPLIVENFNVCKSNNNFSSFEIDGTRIQLDFKNDKFFEKNAFEDFPVVAENIWNELENLKIRQEKYTLKNQQKEGMEDYADNFFEAIENLPEISEQKKIFGNHSKICSKLMKIIENHELEKFCVLSSEIMRNKKISNEHYQECLQLFEKNDLHEINKIRLLLIILERTEIQINEYNKLEQALFNNTTINESQKNLLFSLKDANFKTQNTSNNFLSSLKNSSSLFLKNIISNVYNFKSTQDVNNLIKNNQIDNFELFSITDSNFENLKDFSNIIVFSVNGGNLSEFSELQKLAKNQKKNIVYVMDYLKTPEQILSELSNKK